MMEPILKSCSGDDAAADDIELVPYEARLGGAFVCLITQFIYTLRQSSPAGFITWTTTILIAIPLGLLTAIEAGRSGAKGPVRYPTVIGLLAQFLGISVSFPVVWLPSYLLLGGSRTGAVPALRPYAAVYLMPPSVVLTYLIFNLDTSTYPWTLSAGLLGGPPLAMVTLLLWRLKPKPAEAVTPRDVSRGAVASANCYLIASFVAFCMWVTVLKEILTEYGLSLDAMKDGMWYSANGAVRFMVIDAGVLFASALCYVASVDPVDAVASALISPVIGPGASLGLMLWGHERLREGKIKAELVGSEDKKK